MRRTLLRSLPILALAFGGLGCNAEQVVTARPNPTPTTPPPVEIAGLRLDLNIPPALISGFRVSPYVNAFVGPSQMNLPQLVWQTSDSSVLAIEGTSGQRGLLRAGRPGKATLIVSGYGATTRVDVEVYAEPAVGGDLSGVIVHDFQFVTYASPGDGFAYVPALTLSSLAAPGFDVLAVRFDIPGLSPLHGCSAVRPVGTSATPLFREDHGDWDLYYTSPKTHDPGARVLGTVFVRIAGEVRQLVIDGPIVPGGPPTTYTGEEFVPWSCG